MSYLRRRRTVDGEYWTIQWRDDRTGRQRSKNIGSTAKVTKTEANIAYAAWQLTHAEGKQKRSRLSDCPTLNDFSVDYLAWRSKRYPSSQERSEQIFAQWLLPIFGRTPIDAIKRVDVEKYVVYREAAPATVKKELDAFKACLNKAVEWEVLGRNQLKGVQAPQDLDDTPPRYYTHDQLNALYEISSWRAWWWKLYVNTGMRRSEGMALEWMAVRKKSIVVTSSAENRTKSGKTRVIPLNDAAQEAIKMIKSTRGNSRDWHPDYVLPRMHKRSMSRWFEYDAERAGIDGTLHDLRHTFCTQLVLAGVHLRMICKLAGHSTTKVTEKYTVLAETDLVNDVQAINL